MDVLAQESMKTVAKHDNQWKLQKHETHQVVERNCECRFVLTHVLFTVVYKYIRLVFGLGWELAVGISVHSA